MQLRTLTFLVWRIFALANAYDHSPAKTRVICASPETFPSVSEDDAYLDDLCTDVIYKLPLEQDESDWRSVWNSSNPLTAFRSRHPGLRVYLSIPDVYLETISPSELLHLTAFLKKVQIGGVDVTANPLSDFDTLKRVLRHQQSIFRDNAIALAVTIDSRTDVESFIRQGIADFVDNVLLIPSPVVGSEGFNLTDIAERVPLEKLVVGFPSVLYNVAASADVSGVSPPSELCRDSNLMAWQPKTAHDGQVFWQHANESWSFRMLAGGAVHDRLEAFKQIGLTQSGILLFDLLMSDQLSDPICLKHRAMFAQSIATSLDSKSRVKRAPQVSAKLADKGGRLGGVLIFAVGDEEEQFKQYYGVYDDESSLPNIFSRLVLGYDDSGKIFDIYQAMPNGLDIGAILDTIHKYYVDTMVSGGGNRVFGAQVQPPSIIVYPNAAGDSIPLPLLITWIRMTNPVNLATRRTRKPTEPTTAAPATTTAALSTTFSPRPCADGSLQRCFIPTGLMDILGISRPTTASTTTRRPTPPREVTTKPDHPVPSFARMAENDASSGAQAKAGGAHAPDEQLEHGASIQVQPCEWNPRMPCTWTCSCGQNKQTLPYFDFSHLKMPAVNTTATDPMPEREEDPQWAGQD